MPLNLGERLQSPIRVEYKLYQSAAATAASDKSLSDSLMPSNCLWRPLPVCCLSWTPTHLIPTHSNPTLPLHSSSGPHPHYCSVGIFFFFWSQMPSFRLAALVWTPNVWNELYSLCHRCVVVPRDEVHATPHLLLRALHFHRCVVQYFCQVFRDWITFCTGLEICQVVFTIHMHHCIQLLECRINLFIY